MLNITAFGDSELIARFRQMPSALRTALLRKITALTLQLEARAKAKVSGPVLRVVTGRLRRSIFSRVTDERTGIRGRVASSGDVKYPAIHEFGGRTPAHIIEPRKAKVLAFMVGGKQVFAKRVHHPGSQMPERSFLRSSLREMRAEIEIGLKDAVREGVAATGGAGGTGGPARDAQGRFVKK